MASFTPSLLIVELPRDVCQFLTKGCIILCEPSRNPHPPDIFLKAVCRTAAQSFSIKYLKSTFFLSLQEKLLEQEPLGKWWKPQLLDWVKKIQYSKWL